MAKKKTLYAIAVVDKQYLRDFKLRKMDGAEDADPEYDKLLNISSGWARPRAAKPYLCRLTGKVVRQTLTSATRWKTRAGCQAALARIEANPKTRQYIANYPSVSGDSYVLRVVDLTQCWDDSITSKKEALRRSFERGIAALDKKLLNPAQ